MPRQKINTAELGDAKCRGLMQVIERIIARHNRGECRLDEETFKLFEIAKSIKWANNSVEFFEAIERLNPHLPHKDRF